MFKVLVPTVALLGLAAFAARTETPAVAAVEMQAQVQPMAWHLSQEGSLKKLAYGVANSDQLSLMMTCAPGDRTAVVYGDVQPDSPRLTLASNGPAEVDPMSGELETRISLDDASLRAFASSGNLRVKGEAGKFNLPASDAERRLVGEFLAHCATGHI